jgi:hypothetical protein
MTEPLFMYSTRTQAKQIVHRTILGGSWSPRLAGYARTKFLTACGVVLTDPQVADIDTAERFCDACLMADYGHVVYTFLDAAGNALYVGQTNNLLRRMEQHGWSSSWFALVVDVRHQIVPAADALRIEAELIRDLDPPFNVVGRAA